MYTQADLDAMKEQAVGILKMSAEAVLEIAPGIARAHRVVFDALVAEGFTAEQAIELICKGPFTGAK